MARKADIQYVHHYYTGGTAAKKVAVKAERKKKPLPLFEPLLAQPDQKITVKVDPVSLGAIVVCAVLVVMMVVSLFQYSAAYQRNVALQEYVYTLEGDQARLDQTYRSGFDLARVEAQALALGMIPADQAQTITISGEIPAPQQAQTLWQRVGMFLGELFA